MQDRICVYMLFSLTDGKLDVYQHNKLLTSIAVWTTFGELAILYNCTRTASVKGEVFALCYMLSLSVDVYELFLTNMLCNCLTENSNFPCIAALCVFSSCCDHGLASCSHRLSNKHQWETIALACSLNLIGLSVILFVCLCGQMSNAGF